MACELTCVISQALNVLRPRGYAYYAIRCGVSNWSIIRAAAFELFALFESHLVPRWFLKGVEVAIFGTEGATCIMLSAAESATGALHALLLCVHRAGCGPPWVSIFLHFGCCCFCPFWFMMIECSVWLGYPLGPRRRRPIAFRSYVWDCTSSKPNKP